ncbi:16S rRNA (guanine(527)-N(7))-methyltransferase RsmG [Bartonella sp. HY329]|uniref:16S rRNA (guanine(527)-N(7))-methyltransferase RsmG n=1 Tax=unclassified Bartonella TaxID=2645622 RepID=UPI0021C5BD42|nr:MULTISPECIES: 16S rRNA (guanine(527)-N(7))-methyltransferase RsmG [unclassified Bartonella]UXM95270.1 16S rRNA (guanine(527)-N(7))-methyltransferase RsmG [Bartonella sp. HY329]UXN09594.1 16S rRNA (guanine(527)-N(7))-methyltransferase RsmG [Bartonella sp. HY328]
MVDKFDQLKEILPDVSRETFDSLLAFEELILKWQAKINLVANNAISELWQRHILDSVQLYQYGLGAHHWFDIGSGGGFPGIIIAILMKQQGQGYICLIESNSKKCAFLNSAIAQLDLPAKVYNDRVEKCCLGQQSPDIISARALASLTDLFGLCQNWLSNPRTYALFQKGKNYKDEILEAQLLWSFDVEIFQSVIDKDSVVLKISNLFPLTKEA